MMGLAKLVACSVEPRSLIKGMMQILSRLRLGFVERPTMCRPDDLDLLLQSVESFV